jgi:hypothetical protein
MTTASAVAPSTSYCSSLEMISSGVISETSGRLPAMKMTEPYSPTARAKGQREAGQQRREDGRKDHLDEGLPARGAERGGGLLDFGFDVLDHRLQGTHDERQGDEGQRKDNAERRVGHLDAERFEVLAEPAVAGVQRGQRDAGHGRRQRKGQIDQRIDEALAGEGVADQHPGHDQAEKALIAAASSEAPKVTRKAASERSPRAMSMICPKPSSDALRSCRRAAAGSAARDRPACSPAPGRSRATRVGFLQTWGPKKRATVAFRKRRTRSGPPGGINAAYLAT